MNEISAPANFPLSDPFTRALTRFIGRHKSDALPHRWRQKPTGIFPTGAQSCGRLQKTLRQP